jgi:hypothetical protein
LLAEPALVWPRAPVIVLLLLFIILNKNSLGTLCLLNGSVSERVEHVLGLSTRVSCSLHSTLSRVPLSQVLLRAISRQVSLLVCLQNEATLIRTLLSGELRVASQTTGVATHILA